MQEQICSGCGLRSAITDGPVHKYLDSSPACWGLFGEILSREYQNYEYMQVHGLTVDAYALQHPGSDNPQTRSSANLHLASLYSYFALGKPIGELPQIKQRLAKKKRNFQWLQPPTGINALTVADVIRAETAAEHCDVVKRWAAYLFDSWAEHHRTAAEHLSSINTRR